MWDFIRSHRPSRSEDWTHFHMERVVDKPRDSTESQSLDLLIDESEIDEKRYYRSTEFRQALLEAKIERAFAAVETPIQNDKRQSWHHRLSTIGMTNTRASQSASALPMFDYEAERVRQLEEAQSEHSSPDIEPAVEAGAPRELVPDANGDESTDGSNASDQRSYRRQCRPRNHTDGLAPVLGRARNSFYGGKKD